MSEVFLQQSGRRREAEIAHPPWSTVICSMGSQAIERCAREVAVVPVNWEHPRAPAHVPEGCALGPAIASVAALTTALRVSSSYRPSATEAMPRSRGCSAGAPATEHFSSMEDDPGDRARPFIGGVESLQPDQKRCQLLK